MTRLITVLFFLFFATKLLAAPVPDLYQAQVAVASQNEADRSRVAPEALKQVIVKIVGNRKTVNDADITALLADADRYVDRYSYQQTNEDADLTTPEELAVTFIFDEQRVDNALQAIGLPTWSENRPEILLWLATDIGGQQRLIGDYDDKSLTDLIHSISEKRGLPVNMPVMDLEDLTQISFSDIWTSNNETVKTASERYGAKIIVSAQLRGSDSQAGISWQALMNNDVERWQSEGDVNQALTQGLHQLADILGQRFAQKMGDTQQLSIQITNVKNYQDYSRLLAYFNNMQAVDSVKVVNMRNEVLTLDIGLSGDEAKFRELLAFDGQLESQDSSADSQVEQFRFVP